MNAPALHVLAAEYRSAAEKLADLDLDMQTISDTLEGLSGDLEDKATNVAKFLLNLEASAVAIKQAEAQMKARREAIEHRADSLRDYLHVAMETTGIQKIASPWFVISLAKLPASVDVEDESQLPSEYVVQPEPPAPRPDKRKMLEVLKTGVAIPGARLKTGGTRLSIR